MRQHMSAALLGALVCGAMGVLSSSAQAALISDPGVNPAVKMGGLLFPGFGSGSNLNDGSTTPDIYYFNGAGPEAALGYDLGVQASVTTITLKQLTDGGLRKRIATANVFTSAGMTNWSLADADDVTLNLNQSTSWIMVQPLTFHAGGSAFETRLNELEVNASSFTPLVNVVTGATLTESGSWTAGNVSYLKNGFIGSQWNDYFASQTYFNQTTGSPILTFDFLEAKTVNKFGLGQFAQNNSRNMVANFTIEFSNLSDFSVLTGMVSGTMYNDLYYQQVDFSSITARYARFIPTSNHLYGGGDTFRGFTEFQFFQASAPVPEPASFAWLGLAGLGLWRRRG